MNLPTLLRANFQQPLVVAAVSVVAAHLVASSLFFMDASHFERVFWAVVSTTVLGFATYVYSSLRPLARGVVCVVIAVPAITVGIGIHAVHVYQVGVHESDYTGIAMLVAGPVLLVAGSTFLVRTVHTWWRRLLLLPIAPVFAFFVLFPVTLGVGASNGARVACCDETPADHGFAYEDVTFETPKGLMLSAWYVPSQNGATIIVVHGSGNNRETTLPEAMMLARNGYGLLMLDVEGFGNSEGRGNAYGWTGARSVHAAIDYLHSRPDVDPERIGGLGLSMGGEVLLQAAGESPLLAAVVSEGGTGRTTADFEKVDDGWFQPIVPFFAVVETTMRLISHEPTPPPLLDMVRQIGPRPVFLLAGNLSEETDLMGLYLEEGGPSFEMWTIPEAAHNQGYELHPEEYEQRVVAFFHRALLGQDGRVD